MIKLSVVIPCFNEAENIPLILKRFQAVGPRDDLELLLLDNGSTDDTARVLSELLPEYSFARTSRVPVNKGYGFGIMQGLKASKGEYLGWTHADMQTDPADLLRALDIIEARNHPRNIYVKGKRRGRPLSDSIFTLAMSVFESIYLGTSLWDINAQPNIFHRSFLQSWKSPPDDFALDLYAFYLARQQGLEIVRFDVHFPQRIHGSSKWNTGLAAKWKFIKRTLDFSTRLKQAFGSMADD